MSFVEDDNGNHIIDEDGNKITFSVSYGVDNTPAYIHREMMHINDDGHVDTENRNIKIKDGVNSDHAVSKAQLDTTKVSIVELIKSSIQTALNKFSTDFRKAMIEFRNKQVRDRVGRKPCQRPIIPGSNY